MSYILCLLALSQLDMGLAQAVCTTQQHTLAAEDMQVFSVEQ